LASEGGDDFAQACNRMNATSSTHVQFANDASGWLHGDVDGNGNGNGVVNFAD